MAPAATPRHLLALQWRQSISFPWRIVFSSTTAPLDVRRGHHGYAENPRNRRKADLSTRLPTNYIGRQPYIPPQRRTIRDAKWVKGSTHAENGIRSFSTAALVDRLLLSTQESMAKQTSQAVGFSDKFHHVVAFSGGVDSSVVAALLFQSSKLLRNGSLSDSEPRHTVQAVLGLSPAVPQEQIQLAREISSYIGVDYIETRTQEGTDPSYIANSGQACFVCKTHLYTTLESIYRKSHVSSESFLAAQSHDAGKVPSKPIVKLYNGTNADDLKDTTRVGLIAANNFQVISPLEHLTKAQVRAVAKHLGLPNYNHAASPCLRSRIAIGVPALSRDLQRIAQAERYIKDQLPVMKRDASANIRVRLLAENHARIEVDEKYLELAETVDWAPYFVSNLHFGSVSIRRFQSGSVNALNSSPIAQATVVSRGQVNL
jgi:pyridinium-3,5-biscarboxylic acid mononucleotide sulfurtransferase